MTPDDDPLSAGSMSERTAVLLATVRGLQGRGCGRCEHVLCGHEAVLAVVLGYKDAPRCACCIAADLHEAAPDLCERSLQWIRRRECLLRAWHVAGESEGLGAVERPACLFAAGAAVAAATAAVVDAAWQPEAAASYDAGDLGCGDLVLELRFRLRELSPGAVLHVTARDPAAPVDLPGMVRSCGHALLHASHPDYWIRRKRD